MFSRAAMNVARISVPRLSKQVPVMRTFASTPIFRKNQLLDIVKSEAKIASAVDNELPPEHDEYLKKSGFTVSDKEYDSNVQLTKKLASGEEVHVFFDIDEVSDVPLTPEMGLEEGMEDEFEDKEQFEDELDQYESTFANVKVFITKPEQNNGLFFNLMLRNSETDFFIDYFNYKPDAAQFLANVRDKAQFLAGSEYQGPQFSNLDESLQLSMEKFLEEKGVDGKMAEFIFAYTELKEEASYRKLLSDVQKYLSN